MDFLFDTLVEIGKATLIVVAAVVVLVFIISSRAEKEPTSNKDDSL